MRKHNAKFATRMGRIEGDRTNFPQKMAHTVVNDKAWLLGASTLMNRLLARTGLRKAVL